VRAGAHSARAPILVLSTESADALKQRARAAGATGWIVKPFDETPLLGATRRFAGWRGGDDDRLEKFSSSTAKTCSWRWSRVCAKCREARLPAIRSTPCFRAVHSIKGGAGAFALKALVGFAHKFETVLDDVRSGRVEPGASVVAALLAAGDLLFDLVGAAHTGEETDPDAAEKALEALLSVCGGSDEGGADGGEAPVVFAPLVLDLSLPLVPAEAGKRKITVRFRLSDAALEAGHDPALLLRELAELGEAEIRLDARRGKPCSRSACRLPSPFSTAWSSRSQASFWCFRSARSSKRFAPDPGAMHGIGTGDTVLDVRGSFVPLIDVGRALGSRKGDPGPIVVLVERGNEGHLALMVDGIRDQRQVVIKSLEGNYGHIPGIAAATAWGMGASRSSSIPPNSPRRRRRRGRRPFHRRRVTLARRHCDRRSQHAGTRRVPHRRPGFLHRYSVGARNPGLNAARELAARAELRSRRDQPARLGGAHRRSRRPARAAARRRARP
jgi:HPt (histidine-containing phosphotransfer) domain-containing protein